MSKKTKSVDGKKLFEEVLTRWGLPSSRMGGLEYIVATNILILESLGYHNNNKGSMLDVS